MAYLNWNEFKDVKAYGYIYLWLDRNNLPVYVGKSTRPNEREYQHIKGKPSKFNNYIKEQGEETLTRYIIDYADNKKELGEKERYWINYFNTVDDGYNKKGGSTCYDGDIQVYDFETNEFIGEFKDVRHVATELHLDADNVRRHLQGKTKKVGTFRTISPKRYYYMKQ